MSEIETYDYTDFEDMPGQIEGLLEKLELFIDQLDTSEIETNKKLKLLNEKISLLEKKMDGIARQIQRQFN
jgi:hypothetical protein